MVVLSRSELARMRASVAENVVTKAESRRVRYMESLAVGWVHNRPMGCWCFWSPGVVFLVTVVAL